VINYAWANPTTGIREQAGTQAEARQRVWQELKSAGAGSFTSNGAALIDPVKIYEQEAVGWASNEKYEVTLSAVWDSYAFTDPSTGKRCIVGSFDMARLRIAEAWPEHAPVDSVTIYRQRLAFEVRWDDPEPEAPAPPEAEEETPSSLIAQVLAGNCADFGRAQLLASLWIADALQRRYGPGDVLRPRRTSRRNPGRRYHRYHPGVFRTIRKWWRMFWGTHWNRTSAQPNCQQCGQMLADPDGTICPKCAAKILDRMTPKSDKPHVFEFCAEGEDVCGKCARPEKHAIHGYTGD
jgi:hypothetical protein